MNKELKEQAHKEFDEKFLGMATDFFIVKQGFINSSEGQLKYIDVRNFLDSLIDKTVQISEDRIVGVINKLIKERTLGNPFPTIEEDVAREIIALITNKSDINK